MGGLGGCRELVTAVDLRDLAAHTSSPPDEMKKGDQLDDRPPDHLSDASKAFWTATVNEYKMEPHHLKLLLLACESLDLAAEARSIIARDGVLITDRFGVVRAHPATSILRDAKLAAVRVIRELNLDQEKPQESRPPGLRYLKGGGR